MKANNQTHFSPQPPEPRMGRPGRNGILFTITLLFALAFVKVLGTPSQHPVTLSREYAASTRSAALQSNVKTDLVQWDGYSLFVLGQRILLWSGEFHTWRLPVPDLWLDILQKTKALGMNAISIYVHWWGPIRHLAIVCKLTTPLQGVDQSFTGRVGL